jgi:hypothetical protein
MEEQLSAIGLGNEVFRYNPKSTDNKSKNTQMALCQTKKPFMANKNNQQNEETAYRMGESICKLQI